MSDGPLKFTGCHLCVHLCRNSMLCSKTNDPVSLSHHCPSFSRVAVFKEHDCCMICKFCELDQNSTWRCGAGPFKGKEIKFNNWCNGFQKDLPIRDWFESEKH